MSMYRNSTKELLSLGRGDWIAEGRLNGMDLAGTYDGVIVMGKVDSREGTIEIATNHVGLWGKQATARVSVPFAAVEELVRFEKARVLEGK